MEQVDIGHKQQTRKENAMFIVLGPKPAHWKVVMRRGRNRVYFCPLIPKRYEGMRAYNLGCADNQGAESASQDDIRKQFIRAWKLGGFFYDHRMDGCETLLN